MVNTLPAYDALERLVERTLAINGGTLPEASPTINDASRLVIREMQAQYGAAWLGLVNRYWPEDKAQPYLWQWDGGTVYNFGASFVLPCYDAELAGLLESHDNAALDTRQTEPYDSTRPVLERIQAIYRRVEEIGGAVLVWT